MSTVIYYLRLCQVSWVTYERRSDVVRRMFRLVEGQIVHPEPGWSVVDVTIRYAVSLTGLGMDSSDLIHYQTYERLGDATAKARGLEKELADLNVSKERSNLVVQVEVEGVVYEDVGLEHVAPDPRRLLGSKKERYQA